MSDWQQFLTQSGAATSATAPASMNSAAIASGFVAPLNDLGLIAVAGEDAAKFLHSQLTNDVEHLGAGEVRLAGYCSPKGRLLATLLMWKSADAIMLQLPLEIQAPVQKRIQMFVLRAKAKLADVGGQQVQLGLAGAAAQTVLKNWFPDLPGAPYTKVDSSAGTLLRLADALGAPRYLWIATPDTAIVAWPKLAASLIPAGSQLWRLAAIHAGVPQITLPTQEQFVPQMVNYELIGGVNFKKGCYPGQEIVARTHYLGKVKRRMMLASIAMSGATVEARAGTEVFSSADPDQPCGMIVNAEANGDQRIDCLVELKLAVLDAGSVHLGSATGPTLQFSDLPYTLSAEASPS